MELSFKDNRVQNVVSMPNDPPEIGAEHDRVPRTIKGAESYVKDFQPLRLGKFNSPPDAVN